MPRLKLYAPPESYLAWKALIAAQFGKIQIETTPNFKIGTDNITQEFLALNPLGKVPVLETDEGTIHESNAIARYVARLDPKTHLLGNSNWENAQVEQWIDFASSEIELPTKIWIYPILGLMENNQLATNKAKGDIRKVLDILNEHLESQTFLVGERITLADIVTSLTLWHLFDKVLEPGFRKVYGNVVRWYLTLMNQPQFKSVVGEITLCTKMQVPAKGTSNQEATQKEKQPKEKKEKQPQEKKQEKAPAAPKKEKKVEEEEEEEGEKEAKSANPLDQLPKSNFNLDDWKRFYSNNDAAPAATYFWDNYDKEGYSLWYCSYKYNNELDSLLRTCNLIGGWFQRLDRLHKYGFGNAIITKSLDDAHHEISAVWLFRGADIPQEMKNCDDSELYDWTKLDTEDPATRKKVEEYWAWEGSFDGHPFVQGKVFK